MPAADKAAAECMDSLIDEAKNGAAAVVPSGLTPGVA